MNVTIAENIEPIMIQPMIVPNCTGALSCNDIRNAIMIVKMPNSLSGLLSIFFILRPLSYIMD